MPFAYTMIVTALCASGKCRASSTRAQLGMFRVRIHLTRVIITVTNELTKMEVFLIIEFFLLLFRFSVAVETVLCVSED